MSAHTRLRSGGRALGLAFAIALLTSCGKSSTGPTANSLYFKFKANGTQIQFTDPASLWGTFSTAGAGQYLLVISGFDANSNADLQILNNATVGTGTYSGFTSAGSAIVGVIMGYQDTAGVDYVADALTPADATITITSITATTVSGTFFGVVKATGHPDITITQGEFVVTRIN